MNKPNRSKFYLQPNRKSEWTTVEEEQQARQAAFEGQIKALRVILPDILNKFARIPDPRRPRSTRHKLTTLLLFGLLIFIFRYNSRREANRELTCPSVLETLRAVFPEVDSCPHMDTIARVLESIPSDEIEEILGKTVRNLIYKKKFKRMIADGCYVVAVDGTLKWSTDWEFNSQALRKKHGDTTTYQTYVLEAALVGPQGIAIPLMSEFCENPFDNSEQKKQDCERKAFYRLAVRLKSLFPKQPLMIVADGLYPNGPVMALCRTNKWDFMIVLPNEVCLSSVWQEAKAIFGLEPEQKLINHWGDRTQNFKWANQIKYEWKDRVEGKRRHIVLHMVICHETWQRNGETKDSTWAWVSSKAISKTNVLERCNGAARHRWNIEEHILAEKKGGYNYEHMFSLNWNGMKCWHSLMHLGHLLNILTLHTVDLWETVKELGINGTLQLLRQTLTGRWVDISKLAALSEKPQLRLVI